MFSSNIVLVQIRNAPVALQVVYQLCEVLVMLSLMLKH